jgi:hypothetical protein
LNTVVPHFRHDRGGGRNGGAGGCVAIDKTMTGFFGKAISPRHLAKGIGTCSLAGTLLLLLAVAAPALDGRPRNVRAQDLQEAQTQAEAQPTEVQTTQGQITQGQVQFGPEAQNTDPQAVSPPAPAPSRGALETVGRWIDDSVSSAGAGISAAWRGTIGGFGGIGGQANTAAKGAADAATTVAKGAADVAKGAADVATTAAKETAGAVTRLPSSRIASGRERCTTAPNGAPDCRIAADTLCKNKGFNSGTSVDFENVENCPAQVLMANRPRAEHECPIDYFVTRSLCQ